MGCPPPLGEPRRPGLSPPKVGHGGAGGPQTLIKVIYWGDRPSPNPAPSPRWKRVVGPGCAPHPKLWGTPARGGCAAACWGWGTPGGGCGVVVGAPHNGAPIAGLSVGAPRGLVQPHGGSSGRRVGPGRRRGNDSSRPRRFLGRWRSRRPRPGPAMEPARGPCGEPSPAGVNGEGAWAGGAAAVGPPRHPPGPAGSRCCPPPAPPKHRPGRPHARH